MSGLDVASGAVGIASLGIQVCRGLLSYYDDWKDYRSHISSVYNAITILSRTLGLLKGILEREGLDRERSEQVKACLRSCEDGLIKLSRRLQELRKYSTPEGLRQKTLFTAQRLSYPFRSETLNKIQKNVEDIHHQLQLALHVLQLDTITTINASLMANQQSGRLQKIIECLLSPDQIRSVVEQMAGQNIMRPRSSSASSDRTVTPETFNNVLTERPIGPPRIEGISAEGATGFKTMVTTAGCPTSCPCTCHSAAVVKSPHWMNRFAGFLFMRYSGAPLLNSMKCSKRRCRERHRSKFDASFYFPGWMLHRMVEVLARWDTNAAPKLSLRMMRIIPDGSPLFHYAMEGNTAGIRDLFLQNSASPIDVRASDGRSALHVAIYYGHVPTAQFLLDQKADRNYKDKYFQSAIGACWEIFFQKLPIPSIDPCVIGGPTEYSDCLDDRDLSPVHKIVLGISSVSLDDYLSLSTAEIDKQDVMGKTPLHFAAARGDLDAVTTLLRYDADPNITSDALWTPLHEAAISSNHESLRALLAAGAHVDALNNRGQTALSLAAYVRDDPRFFDVLLEHNTDIHIADQNGLTALHRASIRNRVASARRLIDLETDIDALDKKGLSPIHTCALNNSHDVLKLLLETGARADRSATNGRTLLHDAAAVGDLKTIATLSNALLGLDGLDADATDEDERTAQEVFDCMRHAYVSESDDERSKAGLAFQILIDGIRERWRISLLSEKLSETLEVQSAESDEDFLEALDRLESSVESLSIMDD